MSKHSIRLRGFDYQRPGPYFLTLVIAWRLPILAKFEGDELVLTPEGRIVDEEWRVGTLRRRNLFTDEYVIMPDHFHCILLLPQTQTPDSYRPPQAGVLPRLQRPPRSLGSIVAQFKAMTTKRINALWGTKGRIVWQRNYYERIVRDRQALDRIRRYIRQNPAALGGRCKGRTAVRPQQRNRAPDDETAPPTRKPRRSSE